MKAMDNRKDGDDGDKVESGDMPGTWDELTENTRLQFIHLTSADGRAVYLKTGDRVRLRPERARADAFDLTLAGKVATIEAIEQDFDNRLHLAVTVDDDPGKDFGLARLPGHRFFFAPDEVELLGTGAQNRPDDRGDHGGAGGDAQ